MESVKNNLFIAEDKKVYRRKLDGFIMGRKIYLNKFIDGTEDIIDNYEQVDVPEGYEDFQTRIKSKNKKIVRE